MGDNVEPNLYSLADALKIADDLGVDLVEISNNSTPPICRCVDYNKFLYEKKKKDKEVKAAAVKSENERNSFYTKYR